ncbi:hypothetical protein HYT32_00775 [Candidatus Roizmanbacteria bacterium]|nr:hypothetical protein [Candidatus Roizmanbacteria bacterium]
MHNPVRLANAATIVVVVASFICWAFVTVAPDFSFSIANSWFHMINLDVVRTSQPVDFGTAIVGAFSLGVVTWIAFYAFAKIYNNLAKK